MPNASLSKLSDLTGFAWRTVKARLEAANVQPVESGRATKYDTRVALAVLYADLPRAAVDLDPVQERARKDKELADKYAAENAVRRGELHEAEAVLRQWSNVLVACRSRLLRLPGECAAEAPADLRAAVQSVVSRAVHEALHELAAWPETRGEA